MYRFVQIKTGMKNKADFSEVLIIVSIGLIIIARLFGGLARVKYLLHFHFLFRRAYRNLNWLLIVSVFTHLSVKSQNLEDYFSVKGKDSISYLMNGNGEFVIKSNNADFINQKSQSQFFVNKSNFKYGIVDKNNKTILECKYGYINVDSSNPSVYFVFDESYKWRIYNCIKMAFENVESFDWYYSLDSSRFLILNNRKCMVMDNYKINNNIIYQLSKKEMICNADLQGPFCRVITTKTTFLWMLKQDQINKNQDKMIDYLMPSNIILYQENNENYFYVNDTLSIHKKVICSNCHVIYTNGNIHIFKKNRNFLVCSNSNDVIAKGQSLEFILDTCFYLISNKKTVKIYSLGKDGITLLDSFNSAHLNYVRWQNDSFLLFEDRDGIRFRNFRKDFEFFKDKSIIQVNNRSLVLQENGSGKCHVYDLKSHKYLFQNLAGAILFENENVLLLRGFKDQNGYYIIDKGVFIRDYN